MSTATAKNTVKNTEKVENANDTDKPVIGPVTESVALESLLSDAGGWETESERNRRDWDKLTDGEMHSETFSDKKAASVFKGQLKARAKKIERVVRVRTIDKDSDAPMVIFKFDPK